MFGKFAIEGVLGRGGMAEALKCRLSGPGGFDKVVVVKRILPNLVSEPEFVDMFRDEARIAANLSHPNVVQVFETDEIDGIPYIAMEYVHGLTLQRLIRASTFSPKLGAMARIIADVAEGLHYVHNARDRQGNPLWLVHRDVSPANIIISTDGVPKLLDFGVAKAEEKSANTRAGVLKGKPRYMSPEQLQGVELDARSDVFSLGICLYEATTYRSPFNRGQNNDAATMRAILEGDFAKPTDLLPDYPKALEEIVLWALATNPEDRCPAAITLRDRLELFCSTPPFACPRREIAGWVQALAAEAAVNAPSLSAPSYEALRARSRSQSLVTPTPAPVPTSATASATPAHKPGDFDVEVQPVESSNVVTTTKLRLRVLTGFGLAGAMAVGVLLLLLFSNRTTPTVEQTQRPPPRRTVEPPAPPPPTPADSSNAAGAAYLAEAERYLDAQKYAGALELVNRARALNCPDPTLNIRMTALAERIEQGAKLAKGKLLLEDGDVVGAIEAAKAALERDPSNDAAVSLLTQARALQTKQRAASAAPSGKKAPAKAPSKLSVSSTPPAMVFIDGEAIGRSPLDYDVAPGRHSVMVRLKGYGTVETEVQAVGGRTANIVIPLVEERRVDEARAAVSKPNVDPVEPRTGSPKVRVVEDSTAPNVRILDDSPKVRPAVNVLDDDDKPAPKGESAKPKVEVLK